MPITRSNFNVDPCCFMHFSWHSVASKAISLFFCFVWKTFYFIFYFVFIFFSLHLSNQLLQFEINWVESNELPVNWTSDEKFDKKRLEYLFGKILNNFYKFKLKKQMFLLKYIPYPLQYTHQTSEKCPIIELLTQNINVVFSCTFR